MMLFNPYYIDSAGQGDALVGFNNPTPVKSNYMFSDIIKIAFAEQHILSQNNDFQNNMTVNINDSANTPIQMFDKAGFPRSITNAQMEYFGKKITKVNNKSIMGFLNSAKTSIPVSEISVSSEEVKALFQQLLSKNADNSNIDKITKKEHASVMNRLSDNLNELINDKNTSMVLAFNKGDINPEVYDMEIALGEVDNLEINKILKTLQDNTTEQGTENIIVMVTAANNMVDFMIDESDSNDNHDANKNMGIQNNYDPQFAIKLFVKNQSGENSPQLEKSNSDSKSNENANVQSKAGTLLSSQNEMQTGSVTQGGYTLNEVDYGNAVSKINSKSENIHKLNVDSVDALLNEQVIIKNVKTKNSSTKANDSAIIEESDYSLHEVNKSGGNIQASSVKNNRSQIPGSETKSIPINSYNDVIEENPSSFRENTQMVSTKSLSDLINNQNDVKTTENPKFAIETKYVKLNQQSRNVEQTTQHIKNDANFVKVQFEETEIATTSNELEANSKETLMGELGKSGLEIKHELGDQKVRKDFEKINPKSVSSKIENSNDEVHHVNLKIRNKFSEFKSTYSQKFTSVEKTPTSNTDLNKVEKVKIHVDANSITKGQPLNTDGNVTQRENNNSPEPAHDELSVKLNHAEMSRIKDISTQSNEPTKKVGNLENAQSNHDARYTEEQTKHERNSSDPLNLRSQIQSNERTENKRPEGVSTFQSKENSQPEVNFVKNDSGKSNNQAFNSELENAAEKHNASSHEIDEQVSTIASNRANNGNVRNVSSFKEVPMSYTKVEAGRLIEEVAKYIKEGNKRTLNLEIEPENLGQVKLSIDSHHNKVNAKIEVESAKILQLINNNSEILKHEIQQSGIQLNSLQVTVNGQEEKNGNSSKSKKRNHGFKETKDAAENIESSFVPKDLGYNTYDYII